VDRRDVGRKAWAWRDGEWWSAIVESLDESDGSVYVRYDDDQLEEWTSPGHVWVQP
jgi:hypothetical protein